MGANVSAGPVELGQGKMFLTKRELICTIKRKNFSAVRAVIHWHMLPGEVVSAVSLETQDQVKPGSEQPDPLKDTPANWRALD